RFCWGSRWPHRPRRAWVAVGTVALDMEASAAAPASEAAPTAAGTPDGPAARTPGGPAARTLDGPAARTPGGRVADAIAGFMAATRSSYPAVRGSSSGRASALARTSRTIPTIRIHTTTAGHIRTGPTRTPVRRGRRRLLAGRHLRARRRRPVGGVPCRKGRHPAGPIEVRSNARSATLGLPPAPERFTPPQAMTAREFLGLQPTHNPHRWVLPVERGISVRHAGFLFGGCGLGAAVTALEAVTGRQLVWATAQYLSYACPPEILDL